MAITNCIELCGMQDASKPVEFRGRDKVDIEHQSALCLAFVSDRKILA